MRSPIIRIFLLLGLFFPALASAAVPFAVGGNQAVTLKVDGTVEAWGYNGIAQLGDGMTTNRLSPAAIASLGGSVLAPDAPVIGTVIAGNAQAWSSFNVPANDGGSPITGYTVTPYPAGGTDSNAGTSTLTHKITGLSNGTAYTFTVHATNALGDSVESAASASITPTATAPISGTTFTDNGDGTVTDSTTGLAWMRCAMGQTWDGTTCTGTASTYNWNDAMALTSSFAGHSDWRMPSPWELQTIVDYGVSNSSINSTAFPATPSDAFWSSASLYFNPASAWNFVFNFGVGGFNSKTDNYYARLVRGGLPVGSLTTPTEDFTNNGDGTVTHLKTGLTWMRCTMGQTWNGTACTGTASFYTWDAAVEQTSTFAGHSDWRLPSAQELGSIVEYGAYNPTINSALFSVSGWPWDTFWSASSYVSNPAEAWITWFGAGLVMPNFTEGIVTPGTKSDSIYYVRLVRGGHSFGDFALSVGKAGIGSGTVNSSLAGIACGATCAANFNAAVGSVTLTATPDAGFAFTGWSGACSGTGNCTVTIDAAKNVTATFADTIPNAFTFADQSGVALSTQITSAPVQITGIGAAANWAATGGTACVSTGNNCTCLATYAASGTVTNNQYLCARHTSSGSYSTATNTQITVGGVSDTFTSTTLSAVAPSAPVIGAATAGNTSASVAFTPGAIGSGALVNYTASCSTNNVNFISNTGSASPIAVNGLTNGAAYTCKVKTTSSVGDSPWSALSNAVIPATVSAAPTIGVATAGKASATVAFTPPASNGGAAITTYTATSFPGSVTGMCNAPCTVINVTGLANGTTYTFAVTAHNNAGNSAPSALSNSVTPRLPGVDLVPAAISATATTVVTGTTLTITDTVQNQGATNLTAARIVVKYYLSTDTTITAADKLLGQRTITAAAMMSGAISTATTTLTVPATVLPAGAPSGSFRIGVIVDAGNVQIEANETNNTRASSGAVTVKRAGVDLVPTAVGTEILNVFTGAGLTIADTVQNQGPSNMTATSIVVKYYLSTDATITATDKLLGQRTIAKAAMTAGASSTASSTFTVPAATPAGNYYFGVIVDTAKAQVEMSETNNARPSDAHISIIKAGVDLVSTALNSSVGSVARGGSFTVGDTARNQGSSDVTAANITVKYYLSSDSSITSTDWLIGSRTIPASALTAGASSQGFSSLTVPSTTPVGAYILGLIVDATNAQIETIENNNTLTGGTVTVTQSPPPALGRLNDTGQNRCYGTNSLSCNTAGIPPGQDAVFGRDNRAASNTLIKIGGGIAGFDYTKLGANGAPLTIQNQPWGHDNSGYDKGTEAAGTKWSCVKDNVSALVWEVKTNVGIFLPDLRDKDWTYSWYDSNFSTNGGNAGYTSSSCQTSGRCDTEKYSADVNAIALCGYTDWRMPNVRELQSLSNKGMIGFSPAIDSYYFPNMVMSYYWSASPYAPMPTDAWLVYFGNGGFAYDSKMGSHYVQLVRGAKF